MLMPEAVIVAAVRTPVGRAYKGSLRAMRPDLDGDPVFLAASDFDLKWTADKNPPMSTDHGRYRISTT